jgi:hypothetical protein
MRSRRRRSVYRLLSGLHRKLTVLVVSGVIVSSVLSVSLHLWWFFSPLTVSVCLSEGAILLVFVSQCWVSFSVIALLSCLLERKVGNLAFLKIAHFRLVCCDDFSDSSS